MFSGLIFHLYRLLNLCMAPLQHIYGDFPLPPTAPFHTNKWILWLSLRINLISVMSFYLLQHTCMPLDMKKVIIWATCPNQCHLAPMHFRTCPYILHRLLYIQVRYSCMHNALYRNLAALQLLPTNWSRACGAGSKSFCTGAVSHFSTPFLSIEFNTFPCLNLMISP